MVNSKVKKGERNKRGCNFFQKNVKGVIIKVISLRARDPKLFYLTHAAVG